MSVMGAASATAAPNSTARSGVILLYVDLHRREITATSLLKYFILFTSIHYMQYYNSKVHGVETALKRKREVTI